MLVVCIMILTSFESPAPTYDKLMIEDYEIDTRDLAYDQSKGDFAEGFIPAVDTRTGLPVGISMCPGSGQKCDVWFWSGMHPIIFVGKRTSDGPIMIIDPFW